MSMIKVLIPRVDAAVEGSCCDMISGIYNPPPQCCYTIQGAYYPCKGGVVATEMAI